MKKIVLIVVIFIIIGIIYKFFLVNKYHIDKVDFNTDGIFNKTITIKHQSNNDRIFRYEEILIKDFFSDWVQKEDFYVLYDENNDVKKAVSISKMDQYYLLLRSNSFVISDNEDDELFDENDQAKFLKENNINNDIDLYNYVKKAYYAKSNIFNSIKTLKTNYIINNFVSATNITSAETDQNDILILIDGDIEGYIYNVSNRIKELHILYKDSQYVITLLSNNLVDDDSIINILESIEFAK